MYNNQVVSCQLLIFGRKVTKKLRNGTTKRQKSYKLRQNNYEGGAKWEFQRNDSLILDPEIVENCLVLVLCSQANVCQIAVNVPPLTKSSVIEHLQFVGDNEGNNAAVQALFEHDKTPYTPIDILERMNLLKSDANS